MVLITEKWKIAEKITIHNYPEICIIFKFLVCQFLLVFRDFDSKTVQNSLKTLISHFPDTRQEHLSFHPPHIT